MGIPVGSVFLTIIDTIEGFVGPYVDTVMNLLGGLPVWTQALAILALGIFTLVGLFVFIKKFIKVFLVLAVLGAIGYFLWTQGIIQNIIGSLTGIIL
ncbi:MAG: hypothetical protein PHP61_05895 [Candidatus Izemoplasmatales bacterium]|jgi:hypothetical protein|nr:hypothetical protein [Candidatus Izemoplasmatales bacterium]MDD4355414.1 hypothetical protein [Candidatus Izemoplasmatales bacterium]MDD4988165.1 hypothetical protein [Candidatus Izemoplasmatales bacterium]MDD5602192.1 hypothetical protein [Candidatus Izemoplasmatales bacterium]MDY0373494.1 hypothetical protein [Candidatus Izemoplasmatales bacterium]